MRIRLAIICVSSFICGNVALANNCQDFVGNDPVLNSYLVLNSDCKINRDVLAKVKKINPNINYKLASQDDLNGVDELSIPDGLATKKIKLYRKDGQLAQIEVSRSMAGETSSLHFKSRTVTNAYTFKCSNGNCNPEIGMEHLDSSIVSGMNSESHLSLDSQLFDVNLCEKLKSFFAANPKAAACSGDFEKKSADMLKDYQRTRMNYKTPFPSFPGGGGSGPMGMSGIPAIYGGQLYNAPLATRTTDPVDEYFKDNPSSSDSLSNPINNSKLALAMSLNNDCVNDKRLASTLNSDSEKSKLIPKKTVGKAK